MPNLMRSVPAVTAAAILALAVPAAAVPAVASAAVPAHTATLTAVPAPSARPTAAACSSNPDFAWNPQGARTVIAGGYISCPLPASNLPRTVDATLYRNGVEVAYNRADCYGFSTICSVKTPAVNNPPGYQTWCAYSHAQYDGFYNVTKHVCGKG